MRAQIEQEKADKEIIVEDLNNLYKKKEKLTLEGKKSYKKRVTQGAAATDSSNRSASTSSRVSSNENFSNLSFV